MRDLVEAAVQAAARAGVVAVIVGGYNGSDGNGNGHGTVAPPPGAPADVVARFGAASARVQELERALTTQGASLANITAERDRYCATVREQEAKIRSLPTGGGTPAAGSPVPAAHDLDGQPIAILGLDEEEIAKKLVKKGVTTVGALRLALLDGKLAADFKFTKDKIISVGEALLGKAPPASLPGAGGAASSATAPATGGGVGVPTGHADRAWPERLAAARKKARQRDELVAEIARMEAELKLATDPAVRGGIEANLRQKNGTFDVIGGQVFCLLWSCGLYADPTKAPKNVRDVNVDSALKDAGLMQFMESAPPQDAPTTPAPPAPGPAA